MSKRLSSVWRCNCAVTMREIRARINFVRECEGKRPVTWLRLYQLRLAAAEEWLADALKRKKKDGAGPTKNPYLPDRLIGPSYVFKQRKANRLVKMGIELEIRNTGRKPGSRVIGGKVLQPA